MHRRHLAAAIAAISLLAACQQGEDEAAAGAAPGPLDDLHVLESEMVAAVATDDVEGAIANYAPNVRFVAPGGAPETGIAAVRATFEDMIADPGSDLVVVPGEGWISEGGDLAVTHSQFYYSWTGEDGPQVLRGLSQSVWRKNEGGDWKIVSEVNAELPEASADAEAAAEGV